MATSIRLAQETEQRLDYLVSHTGRTKAYYLREIIEQGIENMEVTTWLLMYWSVSVRDKSEYILLPM